MAFLTCRDYIVTMNEIRIADLKAHLSEHLRGVRKGHAITVMDRDTPIARIVPYEQDASDLAIRKPHKKIRVGKIKFPPPLKIKVDVLALLMDLRQPHR